MRTQQPPEIATNIGVATEEAIVNAMCVVDSMVGRDDRVMPALPHEELIEILRKYGRGGMNTDERTKKQARVRKELGLQFLEGIVIEARRFLAGRQKK